MVERVECVVIGAGAVGLAVARRLALAGREVVVLERADTFGTETSSRNSEIIHAGIYYAKGSYKARFCVAGKRALYDYLKVHGVTHKQLGKLIVATSQDELKQLDQLDAFARGNGVDDLQRLSPAEVRAMEPAVFCTGALWSPSTGIFDSHGFMLALLGEIEERGGAIAYYAPVIGGKVMNDDIDIHVGGDVAMTLRARFVVNSAGLYAQQVAKSIAGVPPHVVPPSYYAKGSYYTLLGKPPFTRPVYPVPEHGGLGVHVSVDLAGQVRFGPDVEWVDRIEYSVNPRRADVFYAAIRHYYPDLKEGALQAGYCGIRPKLQSPTDPAKDFLIQGPAEHGVSGLVNLFGIESPGLTASFPIADRVAEQLKIS
jgi:L-2-hydroxyglutarate oxidase LhgO